MYKYYIKCPRSSQNVLVRRLLYCMIPFSYNGGMEISFEVNECELKWLKGTFSTLEKRSKKENTSLEFEVYKDGVYLEKA